MLIVTIGKVEDIRLATRICQCGVECRFLICYVIVPKKETPLETDEVELSSETFEIVISIAVLSSSVRTYSTTTFENFLRHS